MTPTSLAVFVAVAFFLMHMERGRELMHVRRCVRCNAHPWDRHAKDCPHKKRWG